jgi:hypothetical protein
MPEEPSISKALRQQLLWPPIHAAVDVYQRRRAAKADHFELIWRLIHICESTIITLASAGGSRLREMGKEQEFLRIRERCYGVTLSSTDGAIETGIGALDGSIDKWIEILQYIPSIEVPQSTFLVSLREFLTGPASAVEDGKGYSIDLAPLVRAWGRACDVPPSVIPEKISVRDTFKAINTFRNRFAHVPFPYDQIGEIFKELEICVFRLFEIPPTAVNTESPLSGSLALGDTILSGAGFGKPAGDWTPVGCENFLWNPKKNAEIWDARPFIFLDKMMRPYLLSRLKNDVGSWEYTRYLAEANAVYSLNDSELLKFLPRPGERDYPRDELSSKDIQPEQQSQAPVEITFSTRDEAMAAVRLREFEPAIKFLRSEVDAWPSYHSGWQRLGFAQREFGVDLMEIDPDKAEGMLKDSIVSFNHASGHSDPRFSAEALYNRSKSHWRLWRLLSDPNEMKQALVDVQLALDRFFDDKFSSWEEFLRENSPSS